MSKRLYKRASFVLLILIVFTSIFSNPSIVFSKEKTGEQLAAGKQMVADVLKTLNLKDESYFNKVIRCGDWISSNIHYDYDGLRNGTANRSVYETMRDREGVCEGYAHVFNEFMKQIGVPCIYVVDHKMNHAYNMVLMNDYQWYLVEPQSGLQLDDASSERDIYESEIADLRANREACLPYYSPEEIAEIDESIVQAEQKLKTIEGDGNIIFIADINNFLVGTDDFVNSTIAPGKGYYSFSKHAGTKVSGYPVASTKLRRDLNPEQKELINKISLKFTQSKITINAATCSTDIKLPYEIKNYSISNVIFETDNGIAYELGDNRKIPLDYSFSVDEKGYFNVKSSYYVSQSFKLIARTIFGNVAKVNVVINRPQLTRAAEDSLIGMKRGQSAKLNFTTGATKDNFNIEIDKKHKDIASYDKKTGLIKAKKKGQATLRIKSKTNKNYEIIYYIAVTS